MNSERERMLNCLNPCHPHGKPKWNSKLMALVWPSHGCCRHQGSEPNRSFNLSWFFSLSFSFSCSLSPWFRFSKGWKEINKHLQKKKTNTNGLSLEQMSSTILQLKIYCFPLYYNSPLPMTWGHFTMGIVLTEWESLQYQHFFCFNQHGAGSLVTTEGFTMNEMRSRFSGSSQHRWRNLNHNNYKVQWKNGMGLWRREKRIQFKTKI